VEALFIFKDADAEEATCTAVVGLGAGIYIYTKSPQYKPSYQQVRQYVFTGTHGTDEDNEEF